MFPALAGTFRSSEIPKGIFQTSMGMAMEFNHPSSDPVGKQANEHCPPQVHPTHVMVDRYCTECECADPKVLAKECRISLVSPFYE